MHILKAIAEVIRLVLIPFIFANGIWYLIGSFIAWDWNPMHWWMITSTIGRILGAIIELCILANVPRFWEEI
jgi:hypothetical protein